MVLVREREREGGEREILSDDVTFCVVVVHGGIVRVNVMFCVWWVCERDGRESECVDVTFCVWLCER